MVLTRLNVALRAGRSEVEITLKRLNRYQAFVILSEAKNLCLSVTA